jgi:hypothetical protein
MYSNLTDSTIKYIIQEIGKDEHQDLMICYIIDPLFQELKKRIFPYFALLLFILLFLTVLLIVLVIKIINK